MYCAAYEGQWEDCKPSGQGKMTFDNGDVYEGQWKDGQANGQGKETSEDGSVYEGEYKDGLPNGQGKETCKNGDVFNGEFKEGKRDGQGKLKYSNGSVMEGEWKDGKWRAPSRALAEESRGEKRALEPAAVFAKAAEHLRCPISFSLPVDPVIAEDGHVYERSAIESHFAHHPGACRSPMTNCAMGTRLLPARHVKNMLEELMENGALGEEEAADWNKRPRAR
jgi:hypothetical protein